MQRARFMVLAAMALASILHAAPAPAAPTDEAEELYQSSSSAVYQVQVVDRASGKKTSIGSGFQFSADGLIATNYHVVAGAIQRPDTNRVEYLHDHGGTGSLSVVAVDVVHDLAIVRMDRAGGAFLTLGDSVLPKGAKIFALGNPHDLGFTIIEGTYNGLSKESFIDMIHFSGSLNPGMSGGPVIGHDGRVVGINVATAGNQISFLVPVDHLRALIARPRGPSSIEDQLVERQQRTVVALLSGAWERRPFGPVTAPGRIHPALKCWGGAQHRDKDPYRWFFSMCAGEDRVFLDTEFETGGLLIRYDSLSAGAEMSLPRFYNLYERQYGAPVIEYRNAKEDDVTNFDCATRFVDAAGLRWTSSLCLRQYKKYTRLYDLHLVMAATGIGKNGFVATLAAQGLTRKNALALAERFIQEIRPKPSAPGAAR